MSIEGRKQLAKRGADSSEAEATHLQCAALCWHLVGKKVEVLLITSRDTGRWVLPKGWLMKGLPAAEAASREAFEEAGVEGSIEDHCIGLYSYAKLLAPQSALPCVVSVYPLRVERLRSNFPERDERNRKWFSPRKAAQRVAEPELKALLRSFAPPPPGIGKTTKPGKPSKTGKPAAATKSSRATRSAEPVPAKAAKPTKAIS